MTEFFKYLTNPSELFISRVKQAICYDIDYLSCIYKTEDPEIQVKLERCKKRMHTQSFAGAGCGFAMALSLRRYLPFVFDKIGHFDRAFIDLFLILGGTCGTYYTFATDEFYLNTYDIRRKILLTNDKEYFKNLDKMQKKFSDIIPYQVALFRGLLSEEEMREIDKNDVFKFDPPQEEQILIMEKDLKEELTDEDEDNSN